MGIVGRAVPGLVFALSMVAACGGAVQPRKGGPFAGDAANATYLIEGDEVRLAGGRSTVGEGDAAVDTQLTEGKLEGDLDGDGVTDLLAVVVRDQAGQGATFHLAALLGGGGGAGGGARAIATVPLGERLVVKGLGFEGSDIKLRLLLPDPDNADPRPSKVVEKRFRFQGGALLALESE